MNTFFETERLVYRHWKPNDAEILYQIAKDPDLGPRAGWMPHQSVEESRDIIDKFFNNDHTWAMVLKESGQIIGCIGYLLPGESTTDIGDNEVEVGYWVAKDYWNQGLCSEAMRWLVRYCHQQRHYSTLWGGHFTDNPASGRVMEKCGFQEVSGIAMTKELDTGNDKPVRYLKLYLA